MSYFFHKISRFRWLTSLLLCATFLVSAPHCLADEGETAALSCAEEACAHDAEHAPCLDTIEFRTAVLNSANDVAVFADVSLLLFVGLAEPTYLGFQHLALALPEQSSSLVKLHHIQLIRSVVLLV